MRHTSVLSESWRNLVSGPSKALLLALLSIGVLGGIAATDVRTIVRLSTQAREYRESGAAVYLLSAPAAINGQRCDALGSVAGVHGSGATRPAATQAVFLTSPRSGITTVEATAGLAAVLGVTMIPGAGLWLSESATEALGAGVGTTLPTSLGPVQVVSEYSFPDDAADRSLAYTVVAPVPPSGHFDSCWVFVWPYSPAIEPLIRGAYAGDPAEQSSVTLGQLNTRLGAVLDGPKLFKERTTALAPQVAIVFGVLVGTGAVRARRLELASALHAQVPMSALIVQVWLELLFVMVAATIVTLPLTYCLAAFGNPDPLWPAWSAGLKVVVSGAVSTVISGVLTVVATNESKLFHYFKDR